MQRFVLRNAFHGVDDGRNTFYVLEGAHKYSLTYFFFNQLGFTPAQTLIGHLCFYRVICFVDGMVGFVVMVRVRIGLRVRFKVYVGLGVTLGV